MIRFKADYITKKMFSKFVFRNLIIRFKTDYITIFFSSKFVFRNSIIRVCS